MSGGSRAWLRRLVFWLHTNLGEFLEDSDEKSTSVLEMRIHPHTAMKRNLEQKCKSLYRSIPVYGSKMKAIHQHLHLRKSRYTTQITRQQDGI